MANALPSRYLHVCRLCMRACLCTCLRVCVCMCGELRYCWFNISLADSLSTMP